MTTPDRNLFSSRTFTPSATMILRHAPHPPSAAILAKTSSMRRVDGWVLRGREETGEDRFRRIDFAAAVGTRAVHEKALASRT